MPDEEPVVAASMNVFDVLTWYFDKCRQAGLTEWGQVEAVLRTAPNCTDGHVASVKAAWDMQL